MSSNMVSGERRWASARRGGMTVLGKVAVPKPLNLPSQRLENHGLDPNVEIVPKGTLSWGSRPSSSGSNPWISSSSPNADGGTISPSHLSGRPSSGGSGTRPSTASSDKTQEPVGNAWGTNSRPSSASGTLSSCQTSSSTMRPRSAENRPTSSQLSRFAEPGSKNSVAWGPSGTAERLGVKPSSEDGFSLSSGDFPTLGTEKDNLSKNVESGDNVRPSSASGTIARIKEDTKLQSDIKHGTVNTWRPDGTRISEDDMHPNMEKWPGEHHPYMNANAAPQHFDAWHGPPANGPAGVWYGGRPRGPPYGAPVPPGGFPVEAFPYYHPQMAPPPLAGSQPVPHRGPGPPRGPHPKNGDFYRPKVHDAYARPGMPFRPGFYPGPPGPPGPIAFEGFYGPPPMGYCNNDRDIPYMGMAAGPPVYNGYGAPRPDVGDSHGRAAGHPSGKAPGHMESDHLEDAQGPKRAPLKKHNEYDDQREEGENRRNTMQPDVSYPGKNRLPMISRKNEWGAEVDAEEAFISMKAASNEISSRGYEYQGHSADSMRVKAFEGVGNVKAVNDNVRSESEDAPSFPPEKPPQASENDSSKPVVAKNAVLMHKIDGLNAKVRVFDGRSDGSSTHNRDEERNRSRMVELKNNNYIGEVRNTAEPSERTLVPKDLSALHEVVAPVGDKPLQSVAVRSDFKRMSHGGQGRIDHCGGKGKFSQDADGWKRKHPNTESSSTVIAPDTESSSNAVPTPNVIMEASENSMINPSGILEGDSVETIDSTDNQRAKMRELAKQRALQLQKEEEERTREQKAKALAKLEELNRRTCAGEVANQKVDQSQGTGDSQRKQELPTVGESVVADQRSQGPGLILASKLDVTTIDDSNNARRAGENTDLLESNISPLPIHGDGHDENAPKEAYQFNDGGISSHKKMGYKQKNNSLQKSLNEKSAPTIASDVQNDHSPVDLSCEIKLNESNTPNTPVPVVELQLGQQRKKNNRTGKNKHKMPETPTIPALLPVLPDPNPRKELIQIGKSKESVSNLDISVSNLAEHDDSRAPLEDACSSIPSEESHGRVSNQWKPNTSRKFSRNQQSNRFMGKHHGNDTVVWAPVPTQNKAKGSVDANQNTVQECSVDATQNSMQESANPTKGDNAAHNSSKGKRAEMERYVPKPVAKELAQQGSIPPVSSSTRASRPNEGPGREQSGSAGIAGPQPVSSPSVAYVGPSIENKGDGNHKQPKKDYGLWKPQGAIDTSNVRGLQFGDIPASELIMDIQQSKENVQFTKSETNPASSEPKSSSSFNSGVDNNALNNPTTAAVSKYPSGRDHGATGRGKRQPPKGHRNTGTNPDPENGVGEFDGGYIQSAAHVVNQTDRVGSKENRTSGEWTSPQWQPKSQSNPANNQQGNRPTGIESETLETSKPPKKDHPHRKVQAPPRHGNESANVGQRLQGQSVNVESSMAESIVGYHEDSEREKKPALAKRCPYSPNQDLHTSGDSAPIANADNLTERNTPPGSRRNTRQNTRFSRGHDSRGDWSAGHDMRQHNPPSFRDRPRHNVHYEYQPVSQPVDRGTDGMDHRNRERGQNHPKRGGNYCRRQGGGSVQVDSQE